MSESFAADLKNGAAPGSVAKNQVLDWSDVIPLSYFPALDATLNAASALLLTLGYFFIRNKKVRAHKLCMLSAFATSTLISSVTFGITTTMALPASPDKAGCAPFTLCCWVRTRYWRW